MLDHIEALRRLIASYRERLHQGVPATEGQRLLRLVIELEAELEQLLQQLRG